MSPEEVFGQRLRGLRSVAKLSQVELARRVAQRLGSPVDASAIARIETGARGVKLNEAVAIAQVLEVRLTALVTETDPIDAEVAELKVELEGQESRAAKAIAELEQAQLAIASLDQRIAQLNAAR